MGGPGEEKIEGPSAGPAAHGTEGASERVEMWMSASATRKRGRLARSGRARGGVGLLRAALSARSRWCQTTDQG